MVSAGLHLVVETAHCLGYATPAIPHPIALARASSRRARVLLHLELPNPVPDPQAILHHSPTPRAYVNLPHHHSQPLHISATCIKTTYWLCKMSRQMLPLLLMLQWYSFVVNDNCGSVIHG